MSVRLDGHVAIQLHTIPWNLLYSVQRALGSVALFGVCMAEIYFYVHLLNSFFKTLFICVSCCQLHRL